MNSRHQHKLALAQSFTGAPHTKSHRPFSLHPSNKSRRRDTRLCLFQSGYFHLNHYKWDFPKSPQLRFLISHIVWLSLKHFLVHQSAATNSMQPQPTPEIYSRSSAVELSRRNSQRIKSVVCFRRGALSLTEF